MCLSFDGYAIANANAGNPTVSTWKNTGGIGHVQIVRPQKKGDIGVMVAQAGRVNYNYGTMQQGMGSNRSVIYYINN